MNQTDTTPESTSQPKPNAAMDTTTARVVRIAEQLRALSNNGLQFTDDPYQIERYHKILGLSAELLDLAASQPLDAIKQHFFTDIDYKTPLAVVDTAVFDADQRLLLIQRADNNLWAMPGGACDVGEAPAAAAVREVWEETGYRVEATRLIGLFDGNGQPGQNSRHLYHLLFAGRLTGGAPTDSIETVQLRWFDLEDIPWDALSPGHAARIRVALDWHAAPDTPAYFDRADGSKPATA